MTTSARPGRARRALLAAPLVGVLCAGGVVSCASPQAPPPPSSATTATPPSPAGSLCTAVNDFQAAVKNANQLNASQAGVSGVKSALQNLYAKGQALADAAQAQFAPQVAALRQSLASLQSTLASIIDQQSLSAKLGALTAAVGAVESAGEQLVTSARGVCPSVSPTT